LLSPTHPLSLLYFVNKPTCIKHLHFFYRTCSIIKSVSLLNCWPNPSFHQLGIPLLLAGSLLMCWSWIHCSFVQTQLHFIVLILREFPTGFTCFNWFKFFVCQNLLIEHKYQTWKTCCCGYYIRLKEFLVPCNLDPVYLSSLLTQLNFEYRGYERDQLQDKVHCNFNPVEFSRLFLHLPLFKMPCIVNKIGLWENECNFISLPPS